MTEDPTPDSAAPTPRPVVALVATPGAGGQALAAALGAASHPVLVPTASASAPAPPDPGTPGPQHVISYADPLLDACQATWYAPPEYRPHWDAEPDVIELAERQRVAVRQAVDPARGALWFDERHPLLLSLWLAGNPLIGGAVLVWSPPEDAVVELAKDGIRRAHALALWEHAARRALSSVIGTDLFVCSRAELSGADTTVWSRLESFLQSCGLAAESSGTPVLAADVPLAANPNPSGSDPANQAHHELVEQLTHLGGAHQPLPALDDQPLGTGLSPVAQELLDAHRAAFRIGVEARRAWRAVDRNQREVSRLEAELTQTMDGVNLLVDRLLERGVSSSVVGSNGNGSVNGHDAPSTQPTTRSAPDGTRRPKVLFMVHAFPPEEETGTTLLAEGYVRELAQRGWEVAVLYVSPTARSWETVRALRAPGESFDRIPVPGPPLFMRGDLWSLCAPSSFAGPQHPLNVAFERILTEVAPDLVHVVDNVNLSLDWPERAAARGIPVVRTVSCAEDLCGLIPPVSPISDAVGYCLPPLTPERCARCLTSTARAFARFDAGLPDRTGDTEPEGDPARGSLINLLERKRARTATQYAETFSRVIFASRGFRAYFEGTIPLSPERAVVIPLGIDPLPGQTRPKATAHPTPGRPLVFGAVGTVAAHKGSDALVETFLDPTLLDRDDYRLSIIGGGDGSLLSELLARNPNVTWHGSYRHDELPALLSGIDIGLSTSRFETFHRVTREYLLSGLPVIGSTAFGIPEVVHPGRNGLLFDHVEPGSLLRAVTACLDDPGLVTRLTAGAQTTVIKSVGDEIDQMVALYEDCLESSSVGARNS